MRRPLLALTLAIALAPTLAPVSALAAAHGGEEKKKGGGESYLQMAPLTATVIRRDGHRGVVTVEVGIDSPEEKLKTQVGMSEPRLRAAYVQTLMTYAAGMAPASIPDADFLAREMQRQTDQILGKPGTKLLLGSILVN